VLSTDSLKKEGREPLAQGTMCHVDTSNKSHRWPTLETGKSLQLHLPILAFRSCDCPPKEATAS
jgi:hypothetical protein